MIDLTGCIAIPLLKKSAFTGSYCGMRYRLKKEAAEGEDGGDCIRATIWPEPFSFDMTADEKKKSKDFSFDVDGLQKAVEWLNQMYEKEYPFGHPVT